MNPASFISLFKNRMSYAGAVIFCFTMLLEFFLFIFDFFGIASNMYVGLFAYVVLPPFVLLGIGLGVLGAILKRRRLKGGPDTDQFTPLRVDFSNPRHRRIFLGLSSGAFLLFSASLVASYKAYHYTETNEFCGTLCHQVMHPEYTAYQNSPHARLKCVECHIGPGAGWYVKSKMSGLRQVYKAVAHTFPRPIGTPVHNLRPAQETCEQCHWPEKFYGAVEQQRLYFSPETDSARHYLRMLIRVGGGGPGKEGIHAHMNVNNKVYYVAEDPKRQKISWIKTVDQWNRETIYSAPGSKYKETPPPDSLLRAMDCIDCHNRPSHRFTPPFRLVNEALRYGAIDPAMPGIKSKAVELLAGDYLSQKEGLHRIEAGLNDFYQKEHPDYVGGNQEKIAAAGKKLGELYRRNFFPDMKVRWDTHPDNIGHMISAGCFRCHDGEHATNDGKVLTNDCTACHTFLEQGPPGNTEKSTEGLAFKHPGGGEEWKELQCTECHTGGAD